MLGDWAAAYGKPLDQAVEAFADAGQGEYERLKELGINKNKILEYAKNKGDAIAVSGERILDPQKFMDTLQEMIINQSKDGMLNLSKTLTGMLSTTAGLLKFNIAKLFGYTEDNKIRAGSLLDRIKQKFEKFNTWMQSKDGQATVDKWINAFDNALPQIIELVNTIKEKFKELAGENFVEKLNDSIKNFDPKMINNGLQTIKDNFDSLLDKAMRFAGVMVGIELGKMFGLKGMLVGAAIGAFTPEINKGIQAFVAEEEKRKKQREEANKNWYDWQEKTGGLPTQATSTYAPMQQILEEQKIKENQEFHKFLFQEIKSPELKTKNILNFDKDIKVDVNIDFKGSHLTLDNYEEKINKAVKTSLDSSFDSLIKNLSNGFEFGGSTI